jgi:tetraacyldisaccharide 4'-kinase
MNLSHALAPLGFVYEAAVRSRLALYRRGLLAVHDIGAPVISVGNLTTGGTGKTPLVEWVAREVAAAGRRTCVLTRGYGRARGRKRVVVSDGVGLLADAREGGDEPRLLAERLLGRAAVVCDADRVAAARWAREVLEAEAFILDDGFQHLRLARDLDIVTVDATAPWGGGHLLPRGRLREPLEGLRRADCVVITRAEMASDLTALRAEAERLTGGLVPIFTSRVRTVSLLELGARTKRAAPSASREIEQPAAAFCGLGNPHAFFEHLRRDGYDLSLELTFPDHHAYTQEDIDRIARQAAQRGARSLLTTTKDAVKLRGYTLPLPCFVVETELLIEEAGALAELIRQTVARHSGEAGSS